jgi:branched-subunit amino acid transport protein
MVEKNLGLKQVLGQLEETLEVYLVKKAPFSIPENSKDLIVKYAPYLKILGIVGSVSDILFGALVSPSTAFLRPRYALSYSFNYILSMVALAVVVILEAMAVPGLFKREEKAWRFLFYASLVDIVSGFLGGNWVAMIIGTLISWYVLFQVKEYYK